MWWHGNNGGLFGQVRTTYGTWTLSWCWNEGSVACWGFLSLAWGTVHTSHAVPRAVPWQWQRSEPIPTLMFARTGPLTPWHTDYLQSSQAKCSLGATRKVQKKSQQCSLWKEHSPGWLSLPDCCRNPRVPGLGNGLQWSVLDQGHSMYHPH